MASWRRRLVQKESNRSRRPIIISVGEHNHVKSATAHVSVIDGPPTPTTKTAANSPNVSTTSAAKACIGKAIPDDSNDLLETPVGSEPFDCPATRTETMSHLLNLPADIILHLSHHLTYNSLLSLRSTCRTMHTTLSTNQLSIIRTRLILNYLADEAMQRAAYRRVHPRHGRDTLWDLFAVAFEWQLLERPAKELRCYACLELKPLRMFVERMSSRGTGLGGRYARHRKCKDCMRRTMGISGIWWREHWLRRSETVRRVGRVERYVGWVVRGTEPTKVKRGEEIGVCTECGTGQFELFWGCARCFEKEQTRQQREEWSVMGIEQLDGEELEGWMRWALEKSEAWRGRRDKKKRERQARRAECGGKWWNPRRYAGWMGIDVRWRGSWAERVESLVDHLEETHQRRARLASAETAELQEDVLEGVEIVDNRNRNRHATGRDNTTAGSDNAHTLHPSSSTNRGASPEWKPTGHNTLEKDRRETRCAMCWTPSCRRRRYVGGLTYGPRLELDKCCGDCQEEERLKQLARRCLAAGGCGGGGHGMTARGQQKEQDEEDALACVAGLFAMDR